MINFDNFIPNKKQYRNKNKLAPQWACRCLIVGASGSSKTNTAFNMLLNEEFMLDFDSLYVYAKVDQEKMQFLQKYMHNIEDEIQKQTGESISLIKYSNSLDDLIPVEQLDPSKQNLILLDDWNNDLNDKQYQKILKDYFTMSRHHNTSVILIAHSYYSIPKVIRLNASHVLIYKLNSRRELNQIYHDTPNNVSKETFKEMYARVISRDKYAFLMLDPANPDKKYQYRIGFDETMEDLFKKDELREM